MYISNLQHFLDESGNIPSQMPKEAKNMASFLALVVDETTKKLPTTFTSTPIRCMNKGCVGMVNTKIKHPIAEINWYCPICENEGVISGWQGTKWDNNR